jgi:hypothetical protein
MIGIAREAGLGSKGDMKTFKAFGLIFLAVLPITLLAGTGTSSATVLCSLEIETCPSASAYAAKTKFSAHLVKETVASIVAGTSTLKCKESTLTGITKEKESETLSSEISAFSFAGCSLATGEKSVSCSSAKGIHLPFTGSFSASTEVQGHGTLKLSSSGKGTPAIEFTCEKTNCAYSMEPGFEVGGEPTWVSVTKAAATREKEPTCSLSSEASFSAQYEVSEPASAYLSVAKTVAGVTKLCKAIPPVVGGVRQCPGGEGYSGTIKVNSLMGAPAIFRKDTEKVTCTEMRLTGAFQEDGKYEATNGGIQTFTYNSNLGLNCSSNLAGFGGSPTVAVTMLGLKFDDSNIVYVGREKPQAQIGFQGTNGPAKLRMVIMGTTCNYRRDSLAGNIGNGEMVGERSLVEISATWALEAQPGGCPLIFVQEVAQNYGAFERGGGGDLFVAGA